MNWMTLRPVISSTAAENSARIAILEELPCLLDALLLTVLEQCLLDRGVDVFEEGDDEVPLEGGAGDGRAATSANPAKSGPYGWAETVVDSEHDLDMDPCVPVGST
jgi:hypothetical protein